MNLAVHYLSLTCVKRFKERLMMQIQNFGRPKCIKLGLLDA